MESLLQNLARLLAPLSTRNDALLALVVIAVLVIVLLASAPAIETALERSGRSRDRAPILGRLLRSAALLRPVGGRSISEQVRGELYRDGNVNATIVTNSDFFLFLEIATCAIAIAIGAILALVLNSAFILAIGILGYLTPWLIAFLHNRARKKKVAAEMPRILPRLATAIDLEPSLRDVFARLSEVGVGPLYDEFRWASGQMALSNRNIYDVMRDLDTRNSLPFFSQLADDAEREAYGSDTKMREVGRESVTRALDDHFGKMDEKLGGVPNKVMLAVAPFLLIALLLSALGPLIVTFVSGGPLTPAK